jgi:hypothetical protein
VRVLSGTALVILLVVVRGHHLIVDYKGDYLRQDTHGSRMFFLPMAAAVFDSHVREFWSPLALVSGLVLGVGVFLLATALWGVVRPRSRALWPLSIVTLAVTGVSLGLTLSILWGLVSADRDW